MVDPTLAHCCIRSSARRTSAYRKSIKELYTGNEATTMQFITAFIAALRSNRRLEKIT